MATAFLGVFGVSEAFAACSSDTPASGQTVSCTGTDTVGINAPTASDVTVSVAPSAAITANGPLADGISLNSHAMVTNAGSITVGQGGSAGIEVGQTSGNADALGGSVVLNSGTIVMNGDSAVGIGSVGGPASVTNTGTITTNSANDTGIYSPGVSGPASAVITNSGTIQINRPATPPTAFSLQTAISSVGNASVINSGMIITAPDNTAGLEAYTPTPTDRPSIVNQASGVVQTSGSYSPAVLVGTYQYTDSSTGYFLIPNSGALQSATNHGLLTTSGVGSDGMDGQSIAAGGEVSLNNTGTIRTSGSISSGMGAAVAPTAGASAVLVNSGVVSTSGTDSNGVTVTTFSNTGRASLVNSGSIVATGAGSLGVQINSLAIAGAASPGSVVTVTNGVGGVIRSATADAIEADFGQVILTNQGQIDGNVVLSSGNANSVDLFAGSTLHGALNLGTDPGSTLILGGAGVATYSQAVSGATTLDGNLIKQGTGTWTLDQPLALSGTSSVQAGSLYVNVPVAGSAFTVAPGAVLGGTGTIGGLSNSGVVQPGDAPGTIGALNVLGNYSGRGELVINALLGAPGSPASVLVVHGDTTGARSTVIVNDLGTSGSATSGNGIEVVEVLGHSDPGAFTLGNRVVAGAYQYGLFFGGVAQDADDGDWFLRSTRMASQNAIYATNQAYGASAFMQTLADRIGEVRNVDPGSADLDRSAWIRLTQDSLSVGNDDSFYQSRSASTLLTLGSDLYKNTLTGPTDRIIVGVMALDGQQTGDARISALPLNGTGTGSVQGTGVGAYATWYQSNADRLGAYADTWVVGGQFHERASDVTATDTDYDARSLTASLEIGYAFALPVANLALEPQLQVIHTNYRQDDVTDASGVPVTQGDWNGVSGRVGMRLFNRTAGLADATQFYGEVNLWRDSSVASIDVAGAPLRSEFPRTRTELVGGIDTPLARHIALYANLKGQFGSAERAVVGIAGVRFAF